MKKILLLIAILCLSCSSDDAPIIESEPTCYKILSRGSDNRGDFIIIKYQNYTNRRYEVNNYLDYVGRTQVCEPINLMQQEL